MHKIGKNQCHLFYSHKTIKYLANAYFTVFASSFFTRFLHLPLICHLFLKIATYTATCASVSGSFLFPKERALVIASQFLAFAS